MNRRLARILRANTTLTSLCLVLFVAAAIPVDIRLAIAEAVVAAIVILLYVRRSRNTQQSVRQYVERVNGGLDSARSSNVWIRSSREPSTSGVTGLERIS